MHLRITTLALLLFLFLSVSLPAQILQGSVSDRITGKPLKNVTVSIGDNVSTAMSDRKGHFTLKGLKPGVYYFRISRIGYENTDFEVVINSDSVLSLSVALYPSVRQLDEEKAVSPQRFERDLVISPVSVSVYSREQMIQDAPRSLPEALSGLPGIWTPQVSPGTGSLRIRGLTGNRTLTMVDGIRVNTPLLSESINPWLNTIDPFTVDRVEVLRGSGSVQYGSDAITGVTQVFTRTPRFSDSGFKVHANTFLGLKSRDLEKSLRGELEISGSHFAFSGGFSRRALGNVFPGNAQPALSPTGYGEDATDLKALIKLSSRHLLTFSWQFFEQEDVPDYKKRIYDGFEEYRYSPRSRQLGYVRWTSYYNSKWFNEVKITTSFQKAGDRVISRREKTSLLITAAEETDTWGGTVEVLSNPNPYWHFVSGVEYYSDDVLTGTTAKDIATGNIHGLPSAFQEGAETSGLSLFSQHTLDVLKLRLSFGARANASQLQIVNQEFGNLKVQPSAMVGNISAMYPVHPNVHLTSSFNTGFRTPNLNEFSTLGVYDQGVETPNDSLRPEKSFTSEVGLKARTKFFSGSFVFYRTQLTDQIEQIRSSYRGYDSYEGEPVYKKTNFSHAYVQGFEAEMEVPISRSLALFGSLAYTYGQNLTYNEPMTGIPPINSRLGLRFRSKSGIWSKMEWLHATPQDRLSDEDLTNVFIPDGGTLGWNVVNLHVGYDFNWGYATVGIRNMLDEAYVIHGSSLTANGRVILMSVQLGF
ncbi:MAG: TonB-dependent receptor [Bacteroidia bacterium]|nr:TonB-dependent receptor [Bacteroidia bacterium]